MTDNELTKSEPSNASHEASNRWWDSPIPNRPTAAYHIGRLINQLNWHLQHVLIFAGVADHEEMVDLVLGRVIVASYRLVSSPPNTLASSVTDARERWKRYLCSEAAADDLHAILQKGESVREDDTFTDGFQRHVESYVSPFVQELQGTISQELSEIERWAMELGRALDEGVRRPDVVRYFDGGLDIRIDAAQGQESDLYETVHCKRRWRRNIQPGQLEPDTAWPPKMRLLVSQIRLPEDIGAAILTSWMDEDPSMRISALAPAIESIDTNIREHLSTDGSQLSKAASGNQPTLEHAADQSTIPPDFLSRVMTKKEAAKFHAGEMITNPSAYFRRLIAQGLIHPPKGNGQRWQFDIRNFPQDVHETMRSSSKHDREEI